MILAVKAYKLAADSYSISALNPDGVPVCIIHSYLILTYSFNLKVFNAVLIVTKTIYMPIITDTYISNTSYSKISKIIKDDYTIQ